MIYVAGGTCRAATTQDAGYCLTAKEEGGMRHKYIKNIK